LRALICLLVWAAACDAHAQPGPENVSRAFWTWHARTQPDGALTQAQLGEVRDLLTPDFACLLEVADQFQSHFAARFPQEKPPFAEGDLFTSSTFERPTRFEITSVQVEATTAKVTTKFHGADDTQWEDRLELRLEGGKWKVADVERSGPFEFGNRGSLKQNLYEAMSRDLLEGGWNSQPARDCLSAVGAR